MRTIRNCPVCVVGGAGFLGSHLCEHLLNDRGCQVLVVDNLVAGRREFIPRGATFQYADITESEDHLRKLFERYKIEYVLNYAAHPYVPFSYDRPLHVFSTNATGALNVINAAQDAGCKGILQVSSGELYGNDAAPLDVNEKPRGIREDDPATPRSSYGASKLAIDAMCQVRWREAKTPVIALRQFNCLGPRESHDYIVPTIISQLSWCLGGLDKPSARKVTISLGNNSFRDFLYAGDAVRMAVELLEKGSFGEVYNLGSESGIKIYDLAQKIGKLMGFEKVEIQVDPERIRAWEIWSLMSDNTKIYSVIDGRPQVSLDEALKRTINYYNESGRRWIWEAK